jgi:hypothetical protein
MRVLPALSTLSLRQPKDGERLDRLTVTQVRYALAIVVFLSRRDQEYPSRRRRRGGAPDVEQLQMTTGGKPDRWLKLFKMASEQGSLDMPVRVHKA